MKNFMRKYRYALMSISVLTGYFLFTGGVTQETVLPPEYLQLSGLSSSVEVGDDYLFTFALDDPNSGAIKRGETCEPIFKIEPIYQYLPKNRIHLEYKITRTGSNDSTYTYLGDFHPESPQGKALRFNMPGVYTVTFRAHLNHYHGRSPYAYRSLQVTVTGNPPLPPAKKYVFNRMRVSSAGVITDFTFTDPTNQYFIIKDENKLDMVFKWKPTAAQLQQVPELAANYDIRHIDKRYELSKIKNAGAIGVNYIIHTDETGRVTFRLDESSNAAALRYDGLAKDGIRKITYFLYFTK